MKNLLLLFVFFPIVIGLSAETIINANITSSATWNLAGSPYIIAGNYSIYGASNPIVTIEAGVVVKFNANTSLMIGHNTVSISPGGMIVNGTAENPVLFTANSDTPTPGFWNYVRANVYASVDNVVFNYAVFEYGGSATGLFDVNGGNPQFNHCSFRYSDAYGLYHSSNSASAQIQNCSFENNGGYPVNWNPNLVNLIGSGNSFSGNNPNRILLKDITVTEGVTYADYGIPYEAAGHMTIRNGSNPLVLNNNTQLLFRSEKNLYVGSTSSTSITGSINATGATFGEATPGEGWNGLDFQTFIQNSFLSGCAIKNVSSTQNGSVYVRCNNQVAIQNCSFTLNNNYALYGTAGSNFLFSGNSVSNCTKTVSLYAEDVHKLGSGNNYLNNTDNRIHCQGGQISVNSTWTRQNTSIYIMNNLTLYGSSAPILVIPYGTVLEFAGGKNLSIGSTGSSSLAATLLATGVTFRGAESSSGFWTGLVFNIFGGSSLLSGCIIKDAGYNNAAALQMSVANSTITGCTIYNCAAVGINMNAGSMVSISGNVVFQCGSYPLSIGANSLRVLGGNNYFTGNSIDRIEVRSETVNTSGTWRNPGVPYYFTVNTNIYASDPFPHIKILPGVVIMLPNQVSLTVGSSSSGSLRASLEAEGVTFTRSSADVIPGGLTFNPYLVNELCVLSNCRFEYMQHSSQNCAVYVNGSAPVFDGCTFINNQGGGLSGTTAARPSVLNCSFINNGGYPIKTNAAAFDVVSGVGNFFSGNNPDRILLSGGILGQDYTWDNPSIPVEVSSDISVYSSSAPVLKINSGLNLCFQSGAGLFVGGTSSSSITGGIQAEGAIFSALNAAMGGWDGIQVNPYLVDSSYLRNCIIQYAGTNGNIRFNNSPMGTIESCIIRYGNYGIKLSGANSNPAIIRNHILHNEVGFYCSSNANPLIGGTLGDANSIVGNTIYGVQNTSTLTINAENNWWGDEQGPTVRFGDSVTGNVDCDPWRRTNIGDAPARFHLLSPALSAVVETLMPVLDWEEALDPSPDDVVSYTLELALNAGFSSGLISVTGLLGTVYHVPGETLNDDTLYYWRVRATDTQNQTTTCYEDYFCFSTSYPEYPAPFTTISPVQDESVILTSPLLSWQTSVDPDPGDLVTYTVYRDLTAEFADPDSLLTTETSIFSEFCQPGTLYYWQVKATDLTGRSTFSPVVRFYTDLSATPRAPVNFVIETLGSDIQITWDAVPGADNYLILHSLLPDSGFVQLGETANTSYLHTGAAIQARGFYRVLAEDYFRR